MNVKLKSMEKHTFCYNRSKKSQSTVYFLNSIQTRIYELTQRIMAHLISFIQPSSQ